jgi:lysyl-tRNA synthetase class 2
LTDETVVPQGPEPEPPVPGWPKESGERYDKAKAIAALGHAVYPTKFTRTHGLAAIIREWGELTTEELAAKAIDVSIAGRVLTLRSHGKTGFATLTDGDANLQVYVRKDGVGDPAFAVWNLVDMADFIGVSGRLMRTKSGELTVQASSLVFLSKALLPLPEKWHGVQDREICYRQRYLDSMINRETLDRFMFRSRVVSTIRSFLEANGFEEVETPVLQTKASGAAARPFKSHHNALDMEVFLRIAPETWLKRLIVAIPYA